MEDLSCQQKLSQPSNQIFERKLGLIIPALQPVAERREAALDEGTTGTIISQMDQIRDQFVFFGLAEPQTPVVLPYALIRIFPDYDGLHPLPWDRETEKTNKNNILV